MSSLLFTVALAAPCERPTTSSDLALRLEEAEAAYAQLRPEAFSEALRAGREELPCLTEAVPRPLVARLHRAEGLDAFLAREPSRAAQAFAAARVVEPNHRFPDSMVPAQHPIRMHYAALDLSPASYEELAEPAGGHLMLDARDSLKRPTAWPTLFQLVDDEGSVLATAYLWPDDTTPPYTEQEAVSAERTRRAVRALAVTSAGATLATVGLVVAANSVATDWWALDPSDPQADTLQRRTNVLAGAAAGAGVIALAGGAGAIVTWKLP